MRQFLPRQTRLALVVIAIFAVAVGGGFFAAQKYLRATALDVSAPANYPATLSRAADELRTTPGYAFTVDQTTFIARAGQDTSVSANLTFGVRFLSQGIVSPSGFWQVMHQIGQNDPTTISDQSSFSGASLVGPKGQWRDDGNGWVADTDTPPGLGMDPTSAARLPDLLAGLINVAPLASANGLTSFHGLGAPIDYPGVVASDGLSFTKAPLDVIVRLDAQSRLAELDVVAQNLNALPDQMIIDTKVTFDYGASLILPAPSPMATAVPSSNPSATPSAGPSASPSASPAPTPLVRPAATPSARPRATASASPSPAASR
jgi:hypothetical protein